MLDYTTTAIDIIKEDLKKFSRFVKIVSLVFTTGYFIFVLFLGTGNFVVNLVLASLFFIYTIYDLIFGKKSNRSVKKIVKQTYKWTTLLIRFGSLVAMLYGIYTASSAVPITIILSTLMIILWIFQVMLELFITIFNSKVELIMAAVKQDIDNVKKPITKIQNVIRRVKGEPIPETPPKTRGILQIEKKIEEKRQARADQKAAKKKEKEAAKAAKKQAKPLKLKSNPETLQKKEEPQINLLPMKEKVKK